MRSACIIVLVTLAGSGAWTQNQTARDAVVARAKTLELDTPYVPPPGDPLEHHAAGYAKIVCSAVFVSGFEPAFASENLGYFVAPYDERAKLGAPKVDRAARTVQVTMPNGVVRVAKHVGSQGCVALPMGKTDVAFRPVVVKSALPDPSTQPWPMGDVLPKAGSPAAFDAARLQAAVDAAFDPAGMTAAFVVTHRAHRGRAVWRERDPHDAARELVDGQKPDGDTPRHPHSRGCLRSVATGPGSGMAGARRRTREDSHRRHPAHVERPAHSRTAGS
jgi:hypothetical protein